MRPLMEEEEQIQIPTYTPILTYVPVPTEQEEPLGLSDDWESAVEDWILDDWWESALK